MSDNLKDLLARFADATLAKRMLEDELKKSKAVIAAIESVLIDLFDDMGVSSMNLKHATIAKRSTVYASKSVDSTTQDICDWFCMNGFDDMVRDHYPPASLTSLVKEMLQSQLEKIDQGDADAEGIPEGLEKLIKHGTKTILVMTEK